MNRCTKCNRRLQRATPSGMGPVCERAAFGTKPKRQRAQQPKDERQAQLFAEVRP